jgi:hypothetical protein
MYIWNGGQGKKRKKGRGYQWTLPMVYQPENRIAIYENEGDCKNHNLCMVSR